MSNPLEKYSEYGFSEAFEVVKIAVVMLRERVYRIEIERCYSNPKRPYRASYWVEDKTAGQPAVWVRDYAFSWFETGDPESALAQALGFLAEK
jgi:hypothetical protein